MKVLLPSPALSADYISTEVKVLKKSFHVLLAFDVIIDEAAAAAGF